MTGQNPVRTGVAVVLPRQNVKTNRRSTRPKAAGHAQTLGDRHCKTVALAERMLALHRNLADATIPADKVLYQRQTSS